MDIRKYFGRLFYLLIITLIGAVAGFGIGVLWATDQAVSLNNLRTVDSLSALESIMKKQQAQLIKYQGLLIEARGKLDKINNEPTPTPVKVFVDRSPTSAPVSSAVVNGSGNFSGEDLMQAVNKYRREHGVPELQLHSGLCQLASRRLGELIDLGDLDNHAGFENYFNNHSISDLDGQAISNVAENLASGYSSAWDMVMGWDSSPPHRRFLLADGSYKYGCAAANLGFGVLEGGF